MSVLFYTQLQKKKKKKSQRLNGPYCISPANWHLLYLPGLSKQCEPRAKRGVISRY